MTPPCRRKPDSYRSWQGILSKAVRQGDPHRRVKTPALHKTWPLTTCSTTVHYIISYALHYMDIHVHTTRPLYSSIVWFSIFREKKSKRIARMLLHYLYIYWSDNIAILFVSMSDWPQSELGIENTCLMLNAYKTLYYISDLAFIQLWEFKLRTLTENVYEKQRVIRKMKLP
jgi:hypothetical protein